MKIIEVKNLSFGYKNCNDNVFENVSFEAHEGELIFLCGATAGGKTTLLKCLKPELSPNGRRKGEILFCGRTLEDIGERASASEIGYVMQRPENQTVTDRVRSELAFCGESLGLPVSIIRRQVAEAAAYFGLEHILDEKVDFLSGGQRQLLNLASVMAVNPRLIVLDEPTAQLDPIAAGDFIRTLWRITRELSVTVIIAEHSFEELLPLADKVLFLDGEGKSHFGVPSDAAEKMMRSEQLGFSMPSGIRIYNEFPELRKTAERPLTLGKSREMLSSRFRNEISQLPCKKRDIGNESAISLKNLYFTYDIRKQDVIVNASLDVKKGEVFVLLGSNGSGKSTLLSLISGIEKPYRGEVKILGTSIKRHGSGLYGKILAMLPQDIQSSFLHDSIGEELGFTEDDSVYDFRQLYDMHPYDLSGGQQQLLGIKKLVMRNPEILLLDEPTKGLDGYWRRLVSDTIKDLSENGMTVFIVTHDTELAAMCADRCGIFFDGCVASCGEPHELLASSIFYTTNAARTSRGIYKGAVSSELLLELCRKNGLKEDIR